MDFVKIKYDKGDNFENLTIKRIELIETLKKLGFFAYEYQNTVHFIQIIDNKIKIVSRKKIQDSFLEDYLNKVEQLLDKNNKPIAIKYVKEKFYGALSSYFSEEFLNRLYNDKEINFASDCKGKKIMYYENCILEISASTIKQLNYSQLEDKYIFADQILNRPYITKKTKGNFQIFCENICRSNIDVVDDMAHNKKSIDFDRLKSLETIIGYLLHHDFDRSLKAIILTDSRMSEDGEANGRSGKSLIGKAIGQILNRSRENSIYCEIDGKNWNSDDKNRFEKCNIDTKVIHINDLKRYFDVDSLYTNVTEGVIIKKIYQPPFEIRCKFLLSTNKTVKISGGSDTDRFFQFELSDYYSANNKVDNEFKQWFFTDWDPEEFLKFDNYSIHCIQQYLTYGLYESKGINLGRRMITDHTSREFVTWFDELYKEEIIIKISEFGGSYQVDKKILFTKFIDQNNDFKNPKFTQRKFTQWVRFYCNNNDKELILSETRSGGLDYFIFSDKLYYNPDKQQFLEQKNLF